MNNAHTQHVGKIILRGLYVKSVKKFVHLDIPLHGDIYYEEHLNFYDRYYGLYRMQFENHNVRGNWFPGKGAGPGEEDEYGNNTMVSPGLVPIEDHMRFLDTGGIRQLLTNSLMTYRTMLKHVANHRHLDLFGKVTKHSGDPTEEYTIQYDV